MTCASALAATTYAYDALGQVARHVVVKGSRAQRHVLIEIVHRRGKGVVGRRTPHRAAIRRRNRTDLPHPVAAVNKRNHHSARIDLTDPMVQRVVAVNGHRHTPIIIPGLGGAAGGDTAHARQHPLAGQVVTTEVRLPAAS